MLAGTAVLIAVGIAVFASRENPAPETQPTVEQDADAKPSTNEAPVASEQIPQYNRDGFVPPPSDATGSSPPAAPKQ